MMKKIVLFDADIQAASRLCAAIRWEKSGFALAGVFHSLPVCAHARLNIAPDLLIADPQLPNQPANEVLAALRSYFPQAELALLTADASFGTAREAFKYHVTRYLLKPFEAQEINELLAAVSIPAPACLAPLCAAGSLNIARQVQLQVDQRFGDCRLSLKSLAAEFHLNYSYLSYLFKKQTGSKFSAYVGQLRIDMVKQLLSQTDMPLAEIAAASGFGDAQVLYYAFRKATGMTPKNYRARAAAS